MLGRSLSASAVVAVVSLTSVGPVDLRYRWTPGEALRYQVSQRTTANTVAPEEVPVTSLQASTATMRFDVERVREDGAVTLRSTLETLKVEMTESTEGNTRRLLSFESGRPASDDQGRGARAIASLLGKSYTVLLAADGEVLSVSGMDKLLEEATADMLVLRPALNQIFGDQAMRAQLQQWLGLLGPSALELGESWTKRTEHGLPGVGRVRICTTLKLITVSDNVARVRLIMTLEKVPVEGVQAKTRVLLANATGHGEMLVDLGGGRIRQLNLTWRIPLQFETTGSDGALTTIEQMVESSFLVELLDSRKRMGNP